MNGLLNKTLQRDNLSFVEFFQCVQEINSVTCKKVCFRFNGAAIVDVELKIKYNINTENIDSVLCFKCQTENEEMKTIEITETNGHRFYIVEKAVKNKESYTTAYEIMIWYKKVEKPLDKINST